MSGGDFWSRRKAAVDAEAAADAKPVPVPAPDAEDDRPEEEVLAELGLTAPEEMAAGDDFSAFMRPEIPEYLRKRALRTLWRSNPVLANVDGLNDYDDDFNKPAVVGAAVKTAYQVGKGMLAHIEKMAEDERLEALAEGPTEDAPQADAPVDEHVAAVEVTEEDVEQPLAVAEKSQPEVEGAADAPPASRQRMRFRILD